MIAAINGPVRAPGSRSRARATSHRGVERDVRARLHRDRARARCGEHLVHPPAPRLLACVRVDGLESATQQPTRRWAGAWSRRRSAAEEFEERVGELAEWYAALPTRAVAMTKQLFEHAYAASLEEQLELEAELQQAATETEDFAEGVAAFLDKRAPSSVGPLRSRLPGGERGALPHRHGNSLSGGNSTPGALRVHARRRIIGAPISATTGIG